MKRCTKCGARNLDEEKACTLCQTLFGRGADSSESYEPRLMMKGGTKPTHRSDLARSETAMPVVPPSGPPREDLRAERHYLVLTFGEPLKLDPKVASIVLGRDLDAQVKVPSLKASRRHAELRWKDGRVVIRDLGSRNGTFVEGQRVEKTHVLEDCESIRVGDSLLTYRFLVPGEDLVRQQGPADTHLDEPLVAPPVGPSALPRGIEGELVFFGIGDLLRRLVGLRATGTIEVTTAGSKGQILVRNGVAAETSYAGLDGTAALQAVASLTRGTFRFTPDNSWRAPSSGVHQIPPLDPGR